MSPEKLGDLYTTIIKSNLSTKDSAYILELIDQLRQERDAYANYVANLMRHVSLEDNLPKSFTTYMMHLYNVYKPHFGD